MVILMLFSIAFVAVLGRGLTMYGVSPGAPCASRRWRAGYRAGRAGRSHGEAGARRKTRRLVRKASKIALRLGLDYFCDPPKRPPHMRAATYPRIHGGPGAAEDGDQSSRGDTDGTRKGAAWRVGALTRWGL
jgi:hypothetical protein